MKLFLFISFLFIFFIKILFLFFFGKEQKQRKGNKKKKTKEEKKKEKKENKEEKMTDENKTKKTTFKWKDVIKQELQNSPSQTLKIKQLKKRVHEVWQTQTAGDDLFEDEIFEQQLKKYKHFEVVGDKAKLV
eukprot:c33930_g1_i1.p1 GENE.c33930_g1_i1~~c33930_g1_i1.p1  ORF type:complete len:132 (+),score=44.53 c33930_g1_i1:141-536(+)